MSPESPVTPSSRVLSVTLSAVGVTRNWFKKNYVNIGWGGLFLGFNSYRLYELILERMPPQLTADEEWAYNSSFQQFMTRRCFKRLLAIAEWRDISQGSKLNSKANEMLLVISGSVDMVVPNPRSGSSKHVYVAKSGTMLHVPAVSVSVDPNTGRKVRAEADQDSKQHRTSSYLLEGRATESTRFLVWPIDDLMHFMERDDGGHIGLLQVFNGALQKNIARRDQQIYSEKYRKVDRAADSLNPPFARSVVLLITCFPLPLPDAAESYRAEPRHHPFTGEASLVGVSRRERHH